MTRRTTAVPLLKRRKLARKSSDGSTLASETMALLSKAEKSAVGKRMLITLRVRVSLESTAAKAAVTHPTIKRELLSCAIWGLRSCSQMLDPPIRKAVPGMSNKCRTMTPMMVD